MDQFHARRIAEASEWAPTHLVPGGREVIVHEWRRGQDRGKRRLTHGVYGTENKIRRALSKCGKEDYGQLIWNRFRNGKCMVW